MTKAEAQGKMEAWIKQHIVKNDAEQVTSLEPTFWKVDLLKRWLQQHSLHYYNRALYHSSNLSINYDSVKVTCHLKCITLS